MKRWARSKDTKGGRPKDPTSRPDRNISSWNLKRPLIRVSEEEWQAFLDYCESVDVRYPDALGEALFVWMGLTDRKKWPKGKQKVRVPYYDEANRVYLK